MTHVRREPKTPKEHFTIDEGIAALVRDFQPAWHDFFSEAEIHAHFYHLCRGRFPRYQTTDGVMVPTFHHQYETFWHGEEGDRLADGRGTRQSTLDFVVLNEGFFRRGDYLMLLNKGDQSQKNIVRRKPSKAIFDDKAAILSAVEIKLATYRDTLGVNDNDIDCLEDRMLDSCRKVAREGNRFAYVVGLSHGPQLDLHRAQTIVSMCTQIHHSRFPGGWLRVAVATQTQTVLGGDWSEDVEFPNVTAAGGWPVIQQQNTTI